MVKGRKLSVIVPVFNEERTVNQVIKRLSELRISGWRLEVIIVDDGSTDKTREIINSCKLLNHKINQGKGAAIKTALQKATGEYVIIQDADLEYHPREIKRLVRKLEEGNYPVVFGTRNSSIKNHYKYPAMFWGAKILYWLVNLLYGQNLTDPENCYKLIRRDLLDFNITEKGFGVEIELTAKLARKGILIQEEPIRYFPRGYDEGKKIKAGDGLRALWLVFKFRW